MLKALKRKIRKYDIISFDIFDTLINRIVSTPSDLFYLVAKKYVEKIDKSAELNKLFNERLTAEKIAREKSKKEITLEDIYDNFSKEYNVKKIKELEISAELELCCSNKEMVDFLNYCKDLGKKIIIVSDMYLNKEEITKILKKNNIAFDELFVSSEYGVTKSNRGLFKIVLENYGKNKIIHIGDNFKSDFISPRMVGINSYRYIKHKKNKFSKKQFFLRNLQNKKIYENEYFKYGYSYLGPLMYGFSEYLYSNTLKNDKIIFFAREGNFIKKCFDIYNDLERNTAYMYISRKSVTKYCLSRFKSFKELKSKISISKNEDVETFLKRISSLNDNTKKTLDDNSIDLKESFYCDKVQTFFEKNYSILLQESNNVFNEYLAELGFSKKCAVVDIGWAGSMQDLLSNYLDFNFDGYYFGVREERKSKYKNGFVYNGDIANDEMKTRNYNGLFEIVMSANHGSTIDYIKKNGKIIPVLMENDIPENIMNLIKKIQDGAIEFIRDLKNMEFKYDFTNEDYYKKFCDSGYKPDKELINLFKDFYVYDEKSYKLIENKGAIYYVLHPKSFIHDYKESGWKSAFMKQNFGVYFNFLYCILYKMDKKGVKK